MSNISPTHDSFFRGSMAYVDIARDFLCAHLEPSLLKRIDLNSLQLQSASFIDEAHKELRSDILYSAHIDNKEGYIFILVEHQSTIDKFMAFRMLQYACRIWQMDLDKQTKRQKNSQDKLPALIPLVVYNGKISPYGHSTKLLDCFNEPTLIQEFIFNQFKLIDLTIIPDKELVRHQRVAFMEILQKHIRARNILPIVELMCNTEVLNFIVDLENGRYLYFGLNYLVNYGEASEVNKALNLIANSIPEKSEDIMTIAEGLRHQANIETAQRLIAMGTLELSEIAMATNLPIDEIEQLIKH